MIPNAWRRRVKHATTGAVVFAVFAIPATIANAACLAAPVCIIVDLFAPSFGTTDRNIANCPAYFPIVGVALMVYGGWGFAAQKALLSRSVLQRSGRVLSLRFRMTRFIIVVLGNALFTFYPFGWFIALLAAPVEYMNLLQYIFPLIACIGIVSSVICGLLFFSPLLLCHQTIGELLTLVFRPSPKSSEV